LVSDNFSRHRRDSTYRTTVSHVASESQ
jgi:hypothetical protein